MGKALLGIVIGSAATSAAFVFLDLREPPAVPEAAGVSVQPANVETSGVSNSSARIDAIDPLLGDSAGANAISPSARNPEESKAEITQKIADIRSELDKLIKQNFLVELGPVVTPLPLPPEFDWLGDDVFLERMQRETIDPVWASSTEAQLWDYVGSHPQITEKYGTPAIRCHGIRCLLTWMAYGSTERRAVVQSEFVVLRNGIEERIPELCDLGICPLVLNVQDGVTTVVWGVSRNTD